MTRIPYSFPARENMEKISENGAMSPRLRHPSTCLVITRLGVVAHLAGGRCPAPSVPSRCHGRSTGAIAACFSLVHARSITEAPAPMVATLTLRAHRVRSHRWTAVAKYRDPQPTQLTVARLSFSAGHAEPLPVRGFAPNCGLPVLGARPASTPIRAPRASGAAFQRREGQAA